MKEEKYISNFIYIHFSERPSLFNISSTKAASLQTVIEIDKTHSTYENVIAIQGNKKGNYCTRYNSDYIKKLKCVFI